MHRNHLLGLVFTSLCLWAVASYYFFLHRPFSKGDQASYGENHLDFTEGRVRFQSNKSERQVANLKSLISGRLAVPLPVFEHVVAKVHKQESDVTGEPPELDNGGERHQKPAANDNREFPMDQKGHQPPRLYHDGLVVADHVSDKEAPKISGVSGKVVPIGHQPGVQEPTPQSHLPQQSSHELLAQRLRTLAAGRLDGGPAVAVLVLACNRVTVQRCLDQLLTYRPSPYRFPIIVSQDCKHSPTSEVLAAYGSRISRIQQPDQSEIDVSPKEKKFRGYFKIARHYGWALNQTFFHFNFQATIIVEDDLDVAPDIFEYFSATLPLLHRDPTLWCVSAWNDNGKAALVDESAANLLYRTDFFPGLGWMLTQKIWSELAPKWPISYWDDWVRQPEQRQSRACIRPELSRTRTFGKVGVSNGYLYDKHLKYIKLSDKFVPFTKQDLNYLLKEIYDEEFVQQVYNSPVVTYQELHLGSIVDPGSVRISYHTMDTFKRTAKMLGLMDDFRSGVPRTGYLGIVSFMYKGRRVFLAPNAKWKGYDPSWI